MTHFAPPFTRALFFTRKLFFTKALVLAVALTGCATHGTPSPEASGESVENAAPLFPSALFPGSADRFEAWHCQPANQHLVTATEGENLRVWSLHGAWQLPQAVVASGARYQQGAISFWHRGDEAIVETPRGQLKCSLASRRAAMTRTDEPGTMFAASGDTPDWRLGLAHDRPWLTLELADGGRSITLPYMVSVMDNGAGRVVLENARVRPFFRVRIDAGACFDKARDEPYPARVTLTYDGQQYSGCGQGIAP